MPERPPMPDEESGDAWSEASRAALGIGLSRLEAIFRSRLPEEAAKALPAVTPPVGAETVGDNALNVLQDTFDLSPFERDILLLCAGIELSSSFAGLISALQHQGRPASGDTAPTFSMALAGIPEAHWSALTPTSPLRHWRLVELGSGGLTLAPLRIDERILHYLTGITHLDARLLPLLEPVAVSEYNSMEPLIPSHADHAAQATAAWNSAPLPGDNALPPIIVLCGPDRAGKEAIASEISLQTGRRLFRLDAALLPTTPAELDNLLTLLEREAILSRFALLLDAEALEAGETGDGGRRSLVQRVSERYGGPLIVLTSQRLPAGRRMAVTLDVDKPTSAEQRRIWKDTLARLSPEMLTPEKEEAGEVAARLSAQFNLSTATIQAAARQAAGALQAQMPVVGSRKIASPADAFWNACRSQARPRLDDLAQRILTNASWEALVLPEPQQKMLCHIVGQVRQRQRVYGEWGFAQPGERGVGVTALFAGPSGTGKTLAAEVIAHTLHLDLYRIDLSQVVSKYIGETEKNLRRIFDSAEEGGAVLLFDEADALFGKRSEVKDSHDRYANIEVSYLLQRMESYRGLAILTTNLRSALDTAFVRRLRFIVPFPFPDAVQRAAIWQRAFPPETPTGGLEYRKLAQWNVAGGNIRSAALNAAFLAAEQGEPVRMIHLFQAAQIECAKLDKPLSEAEVDGWLSNI